MKYSERKTSQLSFTEQEFLGLFPGGPEGWKNFAVTAVDVRREGITEGGFAPGTVVVRLVERAS